MKPLYKSTLILLLLVFIAQSCSRKKNTFISRNYHALTTKYNVLYNGNIALEKGKAALNNQYTENFWQLLPVERMQVEDEIIRLGNEDGDPNFKVAEEKAVKAVQKHSMMHTKDGEGKEKNPQMDEAYLLLGKARYYDQRFVPALSAFNFIMNKYPTSDKINQVKIWREKANMRMNNNEVVIEKLKRLIDQENLEKQDLADATSTLAQAYINIKAKDSAIPLLETALQNTKIKNERARYHFIKGQLYNEFGKKDSANMEFDAIIKMHRQIPRAYYINAHLQKSFNYDLEKGNVIEFQEYLTDLEENRENRPFLDKIYYRIAEFHSEREADSLAQVYYNKSLRKVDKDIYLKGLNYETLGNMFFNNNAYKTAGAYYDSTLATLPKNKKPYRVLEKKRRNLDDVIYYEDIAKTNDSILYLINLPKEEQLAYFTKITDSLKAQALAAEAQKEKQKQALKNKTTANNNTFNNSNIRNIGDVTNPTSNNFYFYNTTTAAYGKAEFVKIWGNRKLQDNWRLANQNASLENTVSEDVAASNSKENKLFNPQYYIDQLPTKQAVIDSITKARNYAYYELGVIYKEKFKEYGLARSKFETLLQNQPEARLILPSKYNLYQIYNQLNMKGYAEDTKADIVQNYPKSRYAEILLNPQSELARDENNPEVIYENLYRQFTNQNYAEVISKAETQIKKLANDPLVPKFEILKAAAQGRLYGFETYKEAVNYIALTYTNTEEGKKAQELLKTAIPAMESKDFVADTDAKHFNVIYEFKNNSGENIDNFIKDLETEVKKVKYFDLSVSKDVYDVNTTFVVVHGLTSINGAAGFAELLRSSLLDENGNRVPSKITKPYVAISSPNYTIVQRHKMLNNFKTKTK